ncbi:hypothetical protein RHMOL_Rhmol05G0233900 [Rhododendron molle]|uniref:Uncharacterized protein n=1 Tax=Rhododendron molle TaxID=49168 RepID=A0ACC0NTX4_RHOML|nr:hypothetical protein RHMOL_Rhmol05G0233900 [Rhododendron molle]
MMYIVSLDLVKETYGEVSKPEYRDGNTCGILLGVLNGCLCMLCTYYGACIDVWVMKEYGVGDSLTKLVVMPIVPHPSGRPYSAPSYILANNKVLPSTVSLNFAPLCILENGEILLDVATQFAWYNPKDGTFSYSGIHNCSPNFSAYPYIESLVSPDSNGCNGVQLQY